MSLASLVQMLRDFADDCASEYFAEDPAKKNTEALAIVIAAIRECRDALNLVSDPVERDLIELYGAGRFVVEGLGEVQVRNATNRSHWDHEALTRKLVALAADERRVDEETGEYERESDAVARVLTECAGISYWRVTALRPRGIDPSEYCTEEHRGLQVQLPPKKKGKP
jgi:hypothetical protein